MFNIVLVHPRIPQNTGSIGRMCFNVGFKLHIVKPIVFDISQKTVRRAGLDYWDKLEPIIWENLEEFLNENMIYKNRFFSQQLRVKKLILMQNFKKMISYSLEVRVMVCLWN